MNGQMSKMCQQQEKAGNNRKRGEAQNAYDHCRQERIGSRDFPSEISRDVVMSPIVVTLPNQTWLRAIRISDRSNPKRNPRFIGANQASGARLIPPVTLLRSQVAPDGLVPVRFSGAGPSGFFRELYVALPSDLVGRLGSCLGLSLRRCPGRFLPAGRCSTFANSHAQYSCRRETLHWN
jgi:hypothetical protein